MKIKVIIEEHISKEMEIEAADIEEAMEIAEEMYYNGDFAAEMYYNGDFAAETLGIPNCTLMYADDGEMTTEWVEF